LQTSGDAHCRIITRDEVREHCRRPQGEALPGNAKCYQVCLLFWSSECLNQVSELIKPPVIFIEFA
jgi:hypothetical protein